MATKQPIVSDAAGRRRFACSPAAVAAFIVDESERLLLLSCPEKRCAPGKWEIVNARSRRGRRCWRASFERCAKRPGRTFACVLSE